MIGRDAVAVFAATLVAAALTITVGSDTVAGAVVAVVATVRVHRRNSQ